MQNVLSGNFDQTDASGMRVVFRTPPLLLSNARPAMTLDFGDGSPTVQTNNTGKIVHSYVTPAIVTASLVDADNNPCGKVRFEVPRGSISPWSIGAGACY